SRVDGTTETHVETFAFERTAPSLVFEGVRLASFDGAQHLVVTVQASDDVDLSYVALSAVGLRASDLRREGGIVEAARRTAFADTGGFERVFPDSDDQRSFELALPVTTPLGPAEIASNGLVLVEALAVDASGNQASLSEIAFTGGDVEEEALGLSVRPERIVFTTLLESASIVPTVEYQFRGATPLPGSGSGVSYASSHPERVAVTPAGLVYPLAETAGVEVSIRVTYPGLPPVDVPVEVDPSKSLVGLRLEGLDAEGRLVLPRLASPTALPEVTGLFDDGTEAAVGTQFPLEVLSADPGRLRVDRDELVADVAIGEDAPVALTVRLERQPSVATSVPVLARDALPEVALDLPSIVRVGQRLAVRPRVDDDLGVREVAFFLDDEAIGVRSEPPFELNVDVDEGLAEQTLRFRVEAEDVAGQRSAPAEAEVRVVGEGEGAVPAVEIERPRAMARFVEGTPIRYEAVNPIGASPTRSGIGWVEFLVDGSPAGLSRFPILENRCPGSTPCYYEVWRVDAVAPEISTRETSRVVQAVSHGYGGDPAYSTERVFRVVENQAPLVVIHQPADGGAVTAGETLRVEVEVADDTLNAGVSTELLLDGEVARRAVYADPDEAATNTIVLARTRQRFELPVPEERIGSSLRLRARVTDARGETAQSNEVSVLVQGDQAPTVALTHPVAGSSHVSGAPLELRAEALDDVAIERVDFFADGLLVGSDGSPPYTYFHRTPPGLVEAQPFTLHAVALDSAGHEARSAEVVVTLGPDEQRPVVNIASPTVSRTEAGTDYAEVVEDTEVLLRVAGYDDVGVERLRLRGVRREATRYVLTGSLSDELAPDELAPEALPGALNAFTATRLMQIPETGAASDRYPLEVTAIDRAGNESTASLVVDVIGDEAPEVGVVRSDRDSYFPRDEVELAVQGLDDVGVARIEVDYRVDGALRRSVVHDVVPPARNTQHSFTLDLAELALSNADHTLRAEVHVVDTRGARSDTHVEEVVVREDVSPPLAALVEPTPGAELYVGQSVVFRWRANDESGIDRISLGRGGTTIVDVRPDGRVDERSVSHVVPEGEELRLDLVARDVFGREQTTEWVYPVRTDDPPDVRIVAPPSGVRLVEGEPFTLSAVVTDDRDVESVRFFVRRGGVLLEEHVLAGDELERAMGAGGRVSTGLRVPRESDAGEPAVAVGVAASDGTSSSEALAEIDIVDDLEAPAVRLSDPGGAIRARVGERVLVRGVAEDDTFIDAIQAHLEGPGGRVELPWVELRREDRLEETRRPNPDSFGSEVVAQRFYSDFEGRFEVPTDGSVTEGERWDLVIEVRDRGVTTTPSRPVPITIVGDDVAPTLAFRRPRGPLAERQTVEGLVEASDDVALADLRVFVEGGPVLVEETGLDVEWRNVGFDLVVPAWDEADESTQRITLVAEATDASGNEERLVEVLEVRPDEAPRVRLVRSAPETEVVRGGLAFHTLEGVDDFLGAGRTRLFLQSVHTSLRGAGESDGRTVSGHAELRDDEVLPYVDVAYPEAGGTEARLLLGGQPYLASAGDGVLRVHSPGGGNTLRLEVPAGWSVTTRTRLHRLCDGCACEGVEEIEGDGDVDLSAIGTGVSYADVEFVVRDGAGEEVDFFLRRVRIHGGRDGSLGSVTAYEAAGGTSLPVRPADWLIHAFVRDDAA
ncbi:MAG TPA: Ig-like domain-containing protein, partial [Polyangiaceae bacterium LLY-WYZ-15_(1-7)]|nr:Ig-like domain-containing protein [Polyangiaceae bacterium LLY-WYZ-15_(1-7)]